MKPQAKVLHELRRLVVDGGKPHAPDSAEQQEIERALDACSSDRELRLLGDVARKAFALITRRLSTLPLSAPYAPAPSAVPRAGRATPRDELARRGFPAKGGKPEC